MFWDTSAIVPLVVEEPATEAMCALARSESDMIVWWGTPTECLSAIARRERDSTLSLAAADQARSLLNVLATHWSEVLAGEQLRSRAAALLLRHPLRTADAFQLAAALTWSRGHPEGYRFVTLDERLHRAARGEGFRVVTEGS